MTRDELRAAYPGAADAVQVHEFGCGPVPPYQWGEVRARGYSVSDTLNIFREVADRVLAYGHLPANSILKKIRPQMDHPDFVRYVAAKLGAV